MALFLISSSYSESNIVLVNPNRQIARESETLDLGSSEGWPAGNSELDLELVDVGWESFLRRGVGRRKVEVDLGVNILMEYLGLLEECRLFRSAL